MAVRHIEAHWRDSGRTARLWIMDARSAFPILFFLVHIRLWTFVVAIVFIAFFAAIEHFGFSTTVFLRASRNFLAGPIKVVRPWWRKDRIR